MLRGLILVALGTGLGVVGGRYFFPARPKVPTAGVGRDQRAPITRIAGDMLNACAQARPLLETIQRTTADGQTSPADIAEIMREVNRLQRTPQMSGSGTMAGIWDAEQGEVAPGHDLLLIGPLAAAAGAAVAAPAELRGRRVLQAGGGALAAALVVIAARHGFKKKRQSRRIPNCPGCGPTAPGYPRMLAA